VISRGRRRSARARDETRDLSCRDVAVCCRAVFCYRHLCSGSSLNVLTAQLPSKKMAKQLKRKGAT
jgi:hypothetical protein